MKNWKPLIIAIGIAIILHIGIIPWAWLQGTLEIAPLYLIYTVPAAALAIVIGFIVSLVTRKKN